MGSQITARLFEQVMFGFLIINEPDSQFLSRQVDFLHDETHHRMHNSFNQYSLIIRFISFELVKPFITENFSTSYLNALYKFARNFIFTFELFQGQVERYCIPQYLCNCILVSRVTLH